MTSTPRVAKHREKMRKAKLKRHEVKIPDTAEAIARINAEAKRLRDEQIKRGLEDYFNSSEHELSGDDKERRGNALLEIADRQGDK